MMQYPEGTRVRYLEEGKDGRRTRTPPPGQQTGVVTGERDPVRGARVKWDDGHEGSVLWDWIDREK